MRKDKKIEIAEGVPLRYAKDGRRNRIIGFICGRLFIKCGNYVIDPKLTKRKKRL